MKKNLKGGFTLIELLVVIAIIGILASVVLASLNTARAKGADAKIKAELANARAQAEIYYDSNSSSYSGVCTAPASSNGINGLLVSAAGTASATININGATPAGTAKCNDTGGTTTGWAMEVPLKTSGFYCVENSGKTQTNTATGLSNGTDILC